MEENIERKRNGKSIVLISLAVLLLLGAIIGVTLALTLKPKEEVLDESKYPTMTFVYDDTNFTASVKQNKENKPTGDLVIPSKVKHADNVYSITSIAEDGFCGEYREREDPKYISDITSVFIPGSVEEIGGYAFEYCINLEKVTLSEGVKIFDGYSVFVSCSSLKEIHIPASLESFNSSNHFYRCTSLEKVTVDKNNKYFEVANNILYSKDGTLYFSAQKNMPSSLVIREGTTKIVTSAFEEAEWLTSITLPSSLVEIDSYSFAMTGITSITIPANVKHIGNTALSPRVSTTFENTEGWEYYDNRGWTLISSSQLQDPEFISNLFRQEKRLRRAEG